MEPTKDYPPAGNYPGQGTRVWHRHYGPGLVTHAADTSTIVMVQFDHPGLPDETGVAWSELTTTAPYADTHQHSGYPTKRRQRRAAVLIGASVLVVASLVAVVVAITVNSPTDMPAANTDTTLSADAQFRNALEGTSVPASSFDAAETLAHGFCTRMDEGSSFGAATMSYLVAAEDYPNVTGDMLGNIIGAGVLSYCPEYTGDLDAWLEANR